MKRSRWLLLTVAVLLLGVPAWQTYRQLRQEHLNWALIEGIKHKKDAEVIAALDAGASPNSRDYPEDERPFWIRLWDTVHGKRPAPSSTPTALLLALEQNPFSPRLKETTLLRLIRQGADVETVTKDGSTPLLLAVQNSKSVQIIQSLLERGASLHVRDSSGKTALHWAASPGWQHREIAGLLLQQGAEIDARDHFGRTPLMDAAVYTTRDVVGLLLRHGAQVNLRDNRGTTVLKQVQRYATTNPAMSREYRQIADLLKRAGAK